MIGELLQLIEDLVDSGYKMPSEIDGDIHCFHCGSYIPYEIHESDCPYIKARAILERHKPCKESKLSM